MHPRARDKSFACYYCKKQGHNCDACQALRCGLKEGSAGTARRQPLWRFQHCGALTSATERGVAVRRPTATTDEEERLPVVAKAVTIQILVGAYARNRWPTAVRASTFRT